MPNPFEGEYITDKNRERVAAESAGLLTAPIIETSHPQVPNKGDQVTGTNPEVVNPIRYPVAQERMPIPIRLPFEIPWRDRDPAHLIEAQSKRSRSQQKDWMAVAGLAATAFFLCITGNQIIKHTFPETASPRPIERPSRDPGGNAIYDRLEEIQAPQRQINRIPR